MLQHLVEEMKIVSAIEPQAMSAPITGDYVSLKNVHMAFIVLHQENGNASANTYGVNQATAVAGTSAKSITNSVPIWHTVSCAAGDTLTRQTDATVLATAADTNIKLTVIQIDPRSLDIANGFDCIAVTCTTSHASNFLSAVYYLVERFKEDVPPAAITD